MSDTHNPILSMNEACELGLPGWNIRCNYCGTFGASWLPNERPGWGSLALCPEHRYEFFVRKQALHEMRRINFEQPDLPWGRHT